jgi:hypothetical protein
MVFRQPSAQTFSCDVVAVYGALAGARSWLKTLTLVIAPLLLTGYIIALVMLAPRGCWSTGGFHEEGTAAMYLLIAVPAIVVIYAIIAWARSRKGWKPPGGRLALSEDGMLTVTLGNRRRRELVVDEAAKVELGTWVVGGEVAGPLIFVSSRGCALSVAAECPPLGGDGEPSATDVAVNIDDLRGLANSLGLGPIE